MLALCMSERERNSEWEWKRNRESECATGVCRVFILTPHGGRCCDANAAAK